MLFNEPLQDNKARSIGKKIKKKQNKQTSTRQDQITRRLVLFVILQIVCYVNLCTPRRAPQFIDDFLCDVISSFLILCSGETVKAHIDLLRFPSLNSEGHVHTKKTGKTNRMIRTPIRGTVKEIN